MKLTTAYLYVYMCLFALIGVILYWDIHYFNPPGPELIYHNAVICDDDCPLGGIRLFLDHENKLTADASEEIKANGYQPGAPAVLTVHPDANYWSAHALLDYMTENYRNSPIYFHIGEKPLPSLDMPYWPAEFNPSDFEETPVTIEIGGDNIIRIADIDGEFALMKEAMERVMVLAKNPSLTVFISDDAENYLQMTALNLCETTQFKCRIEFR